jgi:putative ABC transport system permease protein
MLKNYFVIALRFMIRQKGFSIINIAGLTLGIASSLLILLYIHDELTFDKLHPAAGRTYRITQEGKMQGKVIHSAYTAYPLGPELSKDERVESTLRLANWSTFPMRFETRAFTEPNLILADSNFFNFFNFNLIEGDADVLRGEGKLVLTESAAKRYFDYKGPGDKAPIGKKMVLAQGYIATVHGIAADPPPNVHFQFSVILSLDSWTEAKSNSWTSSRVITYVRLRENHREQQLRALLETYVNKYVDPELKALRNVNIQEFRTLGNDLQYGIQPLLDIHLTSNLTDEIDKNSDIEYIYLFSAIAAFIILLACINYMNLSTARSASRAREVGIRKSVGAPNSRLVVQFLLESYFYIVLAVLAAMFIIMVMIGPFNALTGKQLDSSTFFSADFAVGIGIFIVLVGLLAGSYPAFYLTQFKPIDTLKGNVATRRKSYGIRNVLVIFQFFISAGLIIATLTVYVQLRYIQTLEVGFDKHNVINLLHTANLGKNGVAFKDALLKQPEILSASYSNRLPPNIDWQYIFRPQSDSRDYLLNVYEVDYDHLKAMRYSMVKGRFFSPDFPIDTSTVILNETAAKRMKITSIHNQVLTTDYGSAPGNKREIVGIIHDFNYQSLRDSIQPIALVLGRQPNWEMAIRVKEGQQEQAIERVRTLWKKFAPNAPFEYAFLDSNFEEKMETERKIGLLFLLFTVLAILIACLGLLGLATFISEQRTKEIGIRKVLGATTQGLVALLNRDFIRLVLLANVLAWPVVGLLLKLWLGQFAYHITIPWWVFPVSGMATLLIAFLSVSVQAIRAAQGNPVDSLRNE